MKKQLLGALLITLLAATGSAPREMEDLEEYAGRRARLLEQVSGPVVLFAYGSDENVAPDATFWQEPNFYYLTGHDEPGAALLLVPQTDEAKAAGLPAETLYLPPRDKPREHWEGVRLGPDDADARERTGFGVVKPVAELRADLERALKLFPALATLFPTSSGPDAAQSHAGRWVTWLKEVAPLTNLANVRGAIGALRQVKSKSEQRLLGASIERSMDAHREAMRALRPGLYEYEIAALMEYTFERAGCERPAYAPIVGSGFNSTVLHYDASRRQMQAGDVVVIDVAAECAGYAADVTRTLPVSGKFTARQKEIYEIVLGAQNAAIAAVKPGMTLARTGENSLYRIAYDYINTHGKDKKGAPLGKYFIHGLGHHIGLEVHDAGDPNRPLAPGMIITIEPGIYIPEENLGVRIEDDVLVTETGAVLLTASLPRSVDEVERFMAGESRVSRTDLCVVRLAPPLYPPLARQAHIQGKVEALARIDESGNVSGVTLLSGHPLLGEAAQENLQTWRFGCLDNYTKFPVQHTVAFEFKIEGKPEHWAPRDATVRFHFPGAIEVVVPPAPLTSTGPSSTF